MSATTYRHAELALTTREAVLEAIAECDADGIHLFLERHGYKASQKYQLRFKGRSYPSKAILGVAAGLTSQEFFGGADKVVKHLTRLGFEVREGRRVVTALGLMDLARQAARVAPEPFELPELPVEPSAYFASGSNNPAEIRGMAAVAQDVGVAVCDLHEPGILELEKLDGSDIQVFVDSGAFSEVDKKDVTKVVRPITHVDWIEKLETYQRLADVLGDQLWVVAPDQVGNQKVTLDRLAKYKSEISAVAAKGTRVLVAMQKGAVSQAEFAGKVDAILPGVGWLPAIPCKKAATTHAELGAFLDARRPAHVHLLGLGPLNRHASDYLSHVARVGCSVSMDANWISANVGTGGEETKQGFLFEGAGNKARPYTYSQQIARKLLAREPRVVAKVQELALILSFGLTCVLGTQEVDSD